MTRSVVPKLSERDRPQVFRAPPVPFVGSARGKAQSFGASALPFIGPALVVLCVINVVPFLWSIGASFFHFRAGRLNTPPKFLGLGNYVDLISDPDVWQHFTNTGVMIASSVSIQIVVGALLAFLFRRPFPGRRFVLMLV